MTGNVPDSAAIVADSDIADLGPPLIRRRWTTNCVSATGMSKSRVEKGTSDNRSAKTTNLH